MQNNYYELETSVLTKRHQSKQLALSACSRYELRQSVAHEPPKQRDWVAERRVEATGDDWPASSELLEVFGYSLVTDTAAATLVQRLGHDQESKFKFSRRAEDERLDIASSWLFLQPL